MHIATFNSTANPKDILLLIAEGIMGFSVNTLLKANHKDTRNKQRIINRLK
ncbi:Uncharacterised protein [Megamonas hypermegale]|uniref:Uncharacterized protein n=1 Tax=Megamonas hypermegale TaxID=158847 RepID=A0A239TMB5_9FIRM|nr:Uncharacterised protein [Megamonas hypermegale]